MNVRFDFETLERWLARSMSEQDLWRLECATTGSPRLMTDESIARRVGVDRRLVFGWRRRDGLSLETVDRICDQLDVDPCEIWGDYYHRLAEADDGDPLERLTRTERHTLAQRRYRRRRFADVPIGKANRTSPRPQPPLQPCGSYAAAMRHLRDGMTVAELDEACHDAWTEYRNRMQREWRQRQRHRSA